MGEGASVVPGWAQLVEIGFVDYKYGLPKTSQEAPRVQRRPALFFVLSLLPPCARSCPFYFSGFQFFLGLVLSAEWTMRGAILRDDDLIAGGNMDFDRQ